MKRCFEKIVEGILACSGFVTSLTIVLIVLFLFSEALGLFGSKVVEEGYVLALNRQNTVSRLTPAQIKGVFDEEITNWRELGGEDLPIRLFRLEDVNEYYTEEELVSSDIIGMEYGSLFDATQTLAERCGTKIYEVRVVAWYDNENSYVSQMVRTLRYMQRFV